MPQQKKAASTNSVFAKIDKTKMKKAFNDHKADETKFGSNFSDPPGGIEGGIASLVDFKFDQFGDDVQTAELKGMPYMYVAGTIVTPTEFPDDHPARLGIMTKTEGLRVSVTEPMCDTPSRSRKTFEEHMAFVLNTFRQLGVDTASLAGVDDPGPVLESLAATLLKQAQTTGINFGFRTWRGTASAAFPDPRTQCFITEMPEGGAAPEDGGAVEDQTAGASTSSDAPSDDLAELVETATNGAAPNDETAQARLIELAVEAGCDEAEARGTQTWQEVMDMIVAKQTEGGATEETTTTEEWKPAKGDVYRYQPQDPKTKKPMLLPNKKPKLVDVEVLTVDEPKKLVTLKSLDDPKVQYKGVAWTALAQA